MAAYNVIPWPHADIIIYFDPKEKCELKRTLNFHHKATIKNTKLRDNSDTNLLHPQQTFLIHMKATPKALTKKANQRPTVKAYSLLVPY